MSVAVTRHALTEVSPSLLTSEAWRASLTRTSGVTNRTRALFDERRTTEAHVLQTGGAHVNVVNADVTLTGVVVGFDEDELDVLKKGQEIFSGRGNSAIFRVAPRRL